MRLLCVVAAILVCSCRASDRPKSERLAQQAGAPTIHAAATNGPAGTDSSTRAEVAPNWKVLDSARIAWRPGVTPYQLLLEESVPPRDSEPIHRIRIHVPGRKDFMVVDDRGPGEYVPVREAVGDSGLVPPSLPDSSRVLVLPAHGPGGTTILAVFGWAYASEPNEMTLVGFDATGYPRVLFRENFFIDAMPDLDGDGSRELVGVTVLREMYSNCSTTYVPFAVYRIVGDSAKYDLQLSRRYNEQHYAWAGAKPTQAIEVDECTPGKFRIVQRKP